MTHSIQASVLVWITVFKHQISSLSCFAFPLQYIALHCGEMLLKIRFYSPFGVIGDEFWFSPNFYFHLAQCQIWHLALVFFFFQKDKNTKLQLAAWALLWWLVEPVTYDCFCGVQCQGLFCTSSKLYPWSPVGWDIVQNLYSCLQSCLSKVFKLLLWLGKPSIRSCLFMHQQLLIPI